MREAKYGNIIGQAMEIVGLKTSTHAIRDPSLPQFQLESSTIMGIVTMLHAHLYAAANHQE